MTLSQLKDRLSALWAGALAHWLYVIAACACVLLLVGSLGIFKSQETKQVAEQGAKTLLLTKKQVRVKEKVIAQQLDSIRTQTIILKKVVHVRDSAVVAARHHEAKSDSAIHALTHEVLPDADATPSRVFDRLASYKPAKYALGDGDSIY